MIPQSSAFPKTYLSRPLFPVFPLFLPFLEKRPRIGQRFRCVDQGLADCNVTANYDNRPVRLTEQTFTPFASRLPTQNHRLPVN